jgi:bacteriophage lambda ninG protein
MFDYIEYETTQQGIVVVSTETDERYLIEKSKTDEQIRRFKPEVIAEMVDIIPSLSVKECEICGSEFYSQTARQKVCSHECFLERARRTSKKATKKKQDEKKEKEVRKLSLDEKIAKARMLGISYGKYVAIKHAKKVKAKEQ